MCFSTLDYTVHVIDNDDDDNDGDDNDDIDDDVILGHITIGITLLDCFLWMHIRRHHTPLILTNIY